MIKTKSCTLIPRPSTTQKLLRKRISVLPHSTSVIFSHYVSKTLLLIFLRLMTHRQRFTDTFTQSCGDGKQTGLGSQYTDNTTRFLTNPQISYETSLSARHKTGHPKMSTQAIAAALYPVSASLLSTR